jgi:rRNA maturation endonuclease Nob1
MKVILDSAVFINADSFPFLEKNEYVMPSACEAEVREKVAKMRLETALAQHPHFTITDPCMASLQSAQRIAREHGDERLSYADEQILALALESVDRKESVRVYTDDYSLQNLLKWKKIPFSGIQQKGIRNAKSFGTKR